MIKEEAGVNEIYKDLIGKDHAWLIEHKEYGLPREEEILSYVPKSMNSAIIHHSSVSLWGHLMGINLIANEMNDINIHRAIEKINRDYNEHYLFKDFNKSSYRTFIIMSKKHEVVFKYPSAIINQDDILRIDDQVIDFYIEILKHAQTIPVFAKTLEELASTKRESINLKSENERLIKQYDSVITFK